MSSPIREVLQTLARHAELLESGLLGVLTSEADASPAAITALRQASALRPAGEDGYRLHPRLREYLQDHLQLFPAFQSLAEIGSRISQLDALWTEIAQVRQDADQEALASLLSTLQTTVFDIVDSMARNMLLLQTLMSTRFGNVRTLQAKRSQNRYYQQQTATLASDLARLAQVAERLERQASDFAMEALARFVRRNLLGQITAWQQGLSELQTLIRKEIFRLREVEQRHRLLARMDMLLRQQPGWRGFEADLSGEIPDFLLAARLPALVAHATPLDSEPAIRQELTALARSLPPKVSPAPDTQPPKRYTRIVEAPRAPGATPAGTAPGAAPAAQALERLATDVLAAGAQGIRLAAWRQTDAAARAMAPHVWLVFAVMALRGRRMRVELLRKGVRDGERFEHSFDDALACAATPALPD
jgi:hypothetical protein